MSPFAPLLSYLRPWRAVLLRGTLWLTATALLALTIPWMLKRGVEAIERGDYADLVLFAAILALAAVARGLARIASRLSFLHTARRVEVALRRDLLKRLLAQPGPFFDRHRTGDLLARFTGDVTNVRMLAGFGVMTILNAGIVYLLTLVMMLSLSPSLTLVAVLPYPFMLLGVKYLSRRLLHHSGRVQEGLGQVSEAVEEAVSGQAVIRAHGLAHNRCRRFSELNDEYLQRNLSLARLRALVMPVMVVVGPVGTLLVLYYGGIKVASGALSLGDFVAFSAYLSQLAWPTLLLGWVLTLKQRAAASMERLQDLLTLPPLPLPAKTEDSSEQPLHKDAPRIEFQHLDFSYRPGEPVLRDFNLSVSGGSLVGIAGSTGSGKTTLLRLLAGLYLPPPETLLVDGVDLTQLDLRTHRRRISAIPQEGRLFSGSLRENLLYAVPGADEHCLESITRQACLSDELEQFPDGFDTRVGEGGLSLSGGQRQRVSIGRALARDAGLFLLDDPFSHLDAATAQTVWQRIRPQLAGRTVFLVSTRVSLLAAADRIVVLHEGQIRQQGSHDELLRAGGHYARLYHREQLRDALEQS
jgi:ATP-binding cassette subfamily B protein